MLEHSMMRERAFAASQIKNADPWHPAATWMVHRRWKADDPMTGRRAGDEDYSIWHGNIAMNGGASLLWERAITLAPATGTTGGALQALSSANAGIAVGISTASSGSRNIDDLQAATGTTARWIKGMSTATYPSHTDGTASSASREVQFQSQFTTSEANFTWNEWALFNDPNSTGVNAAYGLGRMVNRRVGNLGTKTSAAVWTFTVTLSIS